MKKDNERLLTAVSNIATETCQLTERQEKLENKNKKKNCIDISSHKLPRLHKNWTFFSTALKTEYMHQYQDWKYILNREK